MTIFSSNSRSTFSRPRSLLQLNQSLHDVTAAGELPTTPGDPDAPAEGLALSAVAATVVTNYQTCHENAEQLKALQDWIRQTR